MVTNNNHHGAFPAEELLAYHHLPDFESERRLLWLGVAFAGLCWLLWLPWCFFYLAETTTDRKTNNNGSNHQLHKNQEERVTTVRVVTTRTNGQRSTVTTTTSTSSSSEWSSAAQKLSEILTGCSVVVLCLVGFILTCLWMILSHSSTNTFAIRGVFQAPLMTMEECEWMIQTSYAAAQRNVNRLKHDNSSSDTALRLLQDPPGWQKLRHSSYPTVDLNLLNDPFLPADREVLASILSQRLAPLIQRIFGIVPSALRANDVSESSV